MSKKIKIATFLKNTNTFMKNLDVEYSISIDTQIKLDNLLLALIASDNKVLSYDQLCDYIIPLIAKNPAEQISLRQRIQSFLDTQKINDSSHIDTEETFIKPKPISYIKCILFSTPFRILLVFISILFVLLFPRSKFRIELRDKNTNGLIKGAKVTLNNTTLEHYKDGFIFYYYRWYVSHAKFKVQHPLYLEKTFSISLSSEKQGFKIVYLERLRIDVTIQCKNIKTQEQEPLVTFLTQNAQLNKQKIDIKQSNTTKKYLYSIYYPLELKQIELSIEHPPFETKKVSIDLSEKDHDIDLDLPKIDVEVRNEKGNLVSNAKVKYRDKEKITDSSGKVVFEVVESSKITITHPSYQEWNGNITKKNGAFKLENQPKLKFLFFEVSVLAIFSEELDYNVKVLCQNKEYDANTKSCTFRFRPLTKTITLKIIHHKYGGEKEFSIIDSKGNQKQKILANIDVEKAPRKILALLISDIRNNQKKIIKPLIELKIQDSTIQSKISKIENNHFSISYSSYFNPRLIVSHKDYFPKEEVINKPSIKLDLIPVSGIIKIQVQDRQTKKILPNFEITINDGGTIEKRKTNEKGLIHYSYEANKNIPNHQIIIQGIAKPILLDTPFLLETYISQINYTYFRPFLTDLDLAVIKSFQKELGWYLYIYILFIIFIIYLVADYIFGTMRKRVYDNSQLERVFVRNIYEIPLLDSTNFRNTVQNLHHREAQSSSKLDVNATVRASIKNLGFFTPVKSTTKKIPEYLFLVENCSLLDQQTKYAEYLIYVLSEQDIFLSLFYFDDPHSFYDQEGNEFTRQSILNMYEQSRLVIFSQGDLWIDPGNLNLWHTAFWENWKCKILLTPRAIMDWSYTEKIFMSNGFFIFPATEEGIEFLAYHLKEEPYNLCGKMEFRFPLILKDDDKWLDGGMPSKIEKTTLKENLLCYLGRDGYYWLAACAVYPILNWEITLYLGYNLYYPVNRKLFNYTILENSQKIFDEKNLLRLIQLPWMRQGYMPEWLREELLENLSLAEKYQIHEALNSLIIDSLRKNDHGVYLHKFSTKSLDISQRFHNFYSRSRQAKETLKKELPYQDHIFLDFLLIKSIKRFFTKLPYQFKSILFFKGIPHLGFRFFILLSLIFFTGILILIIYINFWNQEYFEYSKDYLNYSEDKRVQLARDSKSFEILRELVKDKNPKIKKALLKNEHFPYELISEIEILKYSDDEKIELALNSQTSHNILKKLAEDKNVNVHQALLGNNNISTETLRKYIQNIYVINFLYSGNDLSLSIDDKSQKINTDNQSRFILSPGEHVVGITFSGIQILASGDVKLTSTISVKQNLKFEERKTLSIRVNRINNTWNLTITNNDFLFKPNILKIPGDLSQYANDIFQNYQNLINESKKYSTSTLEFNRSILFSISYYINNDLKQAREWGEAAYNMDGYTSFLANFHFAIVNSLEDRKKLAKAMDFIVSSKNQGFEDFIQGNTMFLGFGNYRTSTDYYTKAIRQGIESAQKRKECYIYLATCLYYLNNKDEAKRILYYTWLVYQDITIDFGSQEARFYLNGYISEFKRISEN